MRDRLSEVVAGLLVIVGAAAFLGYAITRSGAGGAIGGYTLNAQFGSVGPLAVGSPVKISGVSIGTVSRIRLNPTTYSAIVDFTIEPSVKIPKDSSAAIESASLLGSDYLSISPGGSNTMLKPGGTIVATQSAINIESLLGKFVFSAANVAGGSRGSNTGAAANGAPGLGHLSSP